MGSLTSCQYQEGYLLEFFPLRSEDVGSKGSVHLADTPDGIKVGFEDTGENHSTQCDCACQC